MDRVDPSDLPIHPSTRTSELEILNEVARTATLDLELRPMLQRVTDTLAQRLNCEFVALIVVDQSGESFVCEAVTSSLPTVIHVGYSRRLGSGVVGRVAASGEALLLDDVRTSPEYVETLPGARSEVCIPIKHHGDLVAVLNLESLRLAAFHDQLPLLLTVADQMAGAIASAQAFAEVRTRMRLMEMMSEISRVALDTSELHELLERVVSFIRERFPLEVVSILLCDDERQVFLQTARLGGIAFDDRLSIDRGICGRAVRSGQTEFVREVATDPDYITIANDVTSELVIPIRFQSRILGVLNLESRSPDVFSPANLIAFEAFALQIAGAIHLASVNARLEETMQEVQLKTKDLQDANAHLATAIETLHQISTLDGLTEVSNRRHFDDMLGAEWRRATRNRHPLSLLMLDIDFFKSFNDHAGHQAGDECLRRVASTIRESLHRPADVVSRYGGEEFAVLLPETDMEHANHVAEAIRRRIEELAVAHPGKAGTHVTVSIGVTTAIVKTGDNIDTFVGNADRALYEAKRLGRNRVVVG